MRTEMKRRRNIPHAPPLADHLKNLKLDITQTINPYSPRVVLQASQAREQPRSHFIGQKHLLAKNGTQRLQHLLRACHLGQVAARPRPQARSA